MNLELSNEVCAISLRGNCSNCISTSFFTSSKTFSEVVMKNTCESKPCSACDKRSAAAKTGLAVSSAIRQTSEGPAGISIATSWRETCCLAAITNWLPGPKILYTLGTLSVPYAIAPMACTPPALKILLTPAIFAAIRIAGFTLPSLLGGVQRTISLQPAIFAGVASINTVLNKGAVPPGIYNPTFSIATLFCQQVTPAQVSTFLPSNFWL